MGSECQLEAEGHLILQKGELEVKQNFSIEKLPTTFKNYGHRHSYR